jgi:hypothetical protein
MAAGLVGLITTIWYWNSRRRMVVSQTRPMVRGDGGYAGEYREMRREDPPPPPPPEY